MAVCLPEGLRAIVVARVVQHLIDGGGLPMLFPAEVTALVVVNAPPLDRADTAVRKSEEQQVAGQAGPLRFLAERLGLAGAPVSQDLSAWLDALQTVAQTPPPDPFVARRVGGLRTLLLDHVTYRDRLREVFPAAVAGVPLTVLRLPPPLRAASAGCPDLVQHVGTARGTRVIPAQWVAGSSRLEGIVQDLCDLMGADEPPPRATTDAAWHEQVARHVFLASRKQDTILVFVDFRAADVPSEVMLFLSVLLSKIRGAEGVPGPRVRMVLIGFDAGASGPANLRDLPLARLDAIEEKILYREVVEELVAAGIEEPEAKSLVADVWSSPPDIDRVHAYASQILAVR